MKIHRPGPSNRLTQLTRPVSDIFFCGVEHRPFCLQAAARQTGRRQCRPIDKAIFGAASPFQITCLNGHVTLALRGPERHDGRVVPKYGDDLATEMDFLSRWVAAGWVVFGRLTRPNGKSMSAEGFTSGVKENGPKRAHLFFSFLQRRPIGRFFFGAKQKDSAFSLLCRRRRQLPREAHRATDVTDIW